MYSEHVHFHTSSAFGKLETLRSTQRQRFSSLPAVVDSAVTILEQMNSGVPVVNTVE